MFQKRISFFLEQSLAINCTKNAKSAPDIPYLCYEKSMSFHISLVSFSTFHGTKMPWNGNVKKKKPNKPRFPFFVCKYSQWNNLVGGNPCQMLGVNQMRVG